MKLLKKKELKNSIAIFTSSIIVAIFNWGLLSLLTKKTDLYIVGIYTMALAISNPIFQLFNLQLRPILVADRKNQYSFNEYFSLRIISTGITIVLGFIITMVLYLNNTLAFSISIMVFLLYAIDSLIEIFNAKLHYDEQFVKISFSNILRASSAFFGILIGVFLFNNVLLGFCLAVIAKTLSLFLNDYRQFRLNSNNKIIIKFSQKLYDLLKYAFPLGITVLVASLNVNISKYFVDYRFGTELQGVFSTISYLFVLGILIISTMSQILIPKMAELYKSKQIIKIKQMNIGFLFISLLVGIALFLFSVFLGKQFLFYFFSVEVASYHKLFPFIMFGAIFSFLQAGFGNCLTATQIIKPQTYFAIISLIINIIINIVFMFFNIAIEFIPIASGFASLVQLILGLFIFNKKLKLVSSYEKV